LGMKRSVEAWIEKCWLQMVVAWQHLAVHGNQSIYWVRTRQVESSEFVSKPSVEALKCSVKPRGAGIPQIKGLAQGSSWVQPYILRMSPPPLGFTYCKA
jgi:hypothetical protein